MPAFTVIASFERLSHADLARARLKAAGITCFLDGEFGGRGKTYPDTHAIDLRVFREDAREAAALLAEDGIQVEYPPEAPPRQSTSCPQCGSERVGYTLQAKLLALLSMLFVFYDPPAPRQRCRRCGRIWT